MMKSYYPDTIQEAYRYLANAKQTLGNSPIEYGRYCDSKYVKEAAGIAYLSALKAIDVYMLSLGLDKKGFPKSFDGYIHVIRNKMPHNGKLIAMMNNVYENLHVLAYYRGGTEVLMVKSGLENCKKIIELIEGTLPKKSLIVNEPEVKYHIKKSKK